MWWKRDEDRTPAEVQEDRVWDARRRLSSREPFFSYLLWSMPVKMDNPKVAAAACDGRKIFFNPDWLATRPDWEVESVLMHEVLHNALLHPFRLADRDAKLWNLACDLVVNTRMKDGGFRLGADWFNPADFDHMIEVDSYRDTAEDIYDRLQQLSPEQKQQMMEAAGLAGDQDGEGRKGKSKGGGMGGDVMEPQLGEGEDPSDAEQEAQSNLRKAIKAVGNAPGDIVTMLRRLTESRVSWRDKVRQFLGGGQHKQETWSRPNRRLLHDGTYIPGKGAYGPGEVVIMIDTSGSIYDGLLQRFIDEVDKAHADFGCDALHVICVDTQVRWEETFGTYDEVHVTARGRGGTSLVAGFNWVRDRGLDPKAMIVFTDLYNHDFGEKPEYPVQWIVWPGGAGVAPFGDIIMMND